MPYVAEIRSILKPPLPRARATPTRQLSLQMEDGTVHPTGAHVQVLPRARPSPPASHPDQSHADERLKLNPFFNKSSAAAALLAHDYAVARQYESEWLHRHDADEQKILCPRNEAADKPFSNAVLRESEAPGDLPDASADTLGAIRKATDFAVSTARKHQTEKSPMADQLRELARQLQAELLTAQHDTRRSLQTPASHAAWKALDEANATSRRLGQMAVEAGHRGNMPDAELKQYWKNAVAAAACAFEAEQALLALHLDAVVQRKNRMRFSEGTSAANTTLKSLARSKSTINFFGC